MTSALILEDEGLRASQMADGFREKGFEPETVKTPEAFLAAFAKRWYEVSIVDIDLGQLGTRAGLPVLKRLRKLERRTGKATFKAVVTSHPSVKEDAIKEGADTFILKGSVDSDVLEVVVQCFAQESNVTMSKGRAAKKELLQLECEDAIERCSRLRHRWKLENWTAIRRSVVRGLSLPFLSGPEAAILTALSRIMSDEPKNSINLTVIECVTNGLRILRDGATETTISRWYSSLVQNRIPALQRWYKGARRS